MKSYQDLKKNKLKIIGQSHTKVTNLRDETERRAPLSAVFRVSSLFFPKIGF